MTDGDRPLSWFARKLADHVQRVSRTPDGHDVLIRAFPRGIPPPRRRLVSVTPYTTGIHDALAFFRCRVEYRGAWTVEIREREFDRLVADRVVPSRATAIATVGRARRTVPALRLTHVYPEALDDVT